MRHYLTPVRMALIKKKKKKLQIINVGESAEKRGPSYTVGRTVN